MPEIPMGRALVVMVGLPHSGKSTWARASGYPMVCPDAVRLAIHGQKYLERAEPLVFVHARVMVRALFEAGHPIVVLDATNVTRRRRDEWRDPEWETYFKVIDTSSVTCMERALKCEFPLGVLARMAGQFQQLDPDETPWPV